ncbi:MAG: hypothetical protein ABI777_08960 [Betaproteobacteria bacterium]
MARQHVDFSDDRRTIHRASTGDHMRHLRNALRRVRLALYIALVVFSSATTIAGSVQASPGQLSFVPRVDFGNQLINTKSATLTIVVTNIGGTAVTLTRADLTNDLDFEGYCPCLGVTLQPGASLEGTIIFKPHTTGTINGNIVIRSDGVGSPQIIELVGVGFAAGSPPATASAIEYHHAAFDHYFVTAIADEILKLDNGVFAGWTRTGQSFKVYPDVRPNVASVCRFFSTSFAPKSSHFYTPDAPECTVVHANSNWLFEAVVFYINAADPSGNCPAATQPVYRLYNNGQGAAPNHRYTTSLTIRAQMIELGWVPEGYGPIGVIMCATS